MSNEPPTKNDRLRQLMLKKKVEANIGWVILILLVVSCVVFSAIIVGGGFLLYWLF